MNEAPRSRVAELTEMSISDRPGVYAFYREGVPVYVGKAGVLRSRLWRNHLRKSPSMTNSALRRNIAESLGISTAAEIKSRRYRTTPQDAVRVTAWLVECDVAWLECLDVTAALTLESELKSEFKPALTKI